MRINLYVNRAEVSAEKLKDIRIAVAIDVLRATTTMVTAFNNGCREIIPMAEVEQALQQAKKYSVNEVLLVGERNEQRIPGFNLSNSPREYLPEIVRDKFLIMTTTNGAQLFKLFRPTTEVLIAAFLNAETVSDYLMQKNTDVAILCAGKYGEFGMEDVVCGGMIISNVISESAEKIQLNDGAIAAFQLYRNYEKKIRTMLAESNHGKRLIEINLSADIDFASQTNIYPILPIWKNGSVRLTQTKNE